MLATKKFMFEESFDDETAIAPEQEVTEQQLLAEEEAEEEKEQVVVPTFSQEEVELARQQGFEAGKQEGLAATTQTLTKQISETLAAIDKRLDAAFRDQETANRELSRSAIAVARGICSKMLPALAEKHSFDEVERVITAVFSKIVDQPRASITVHPTLREAIEERLGELSAEKGYQGRITLLGDEAMAVGDCKVEWASGGGERDTESMWRDITAIVERNLGDRPTDWDEPQKRNIDADD